MNVVTPIQADPLDRVRDTIKDAVVSLEAVGAPTDPRIFAAQQHLLAAYAEIMRFQHEIGGPR